MLSIEGGTLLMSGMEADAAIRPRPEPSDPARGAWELDQVDFLSVMVVGRDAAVASAEDDEAPFRVKGDVFGRETFNRRERRPVRPKANHAVGQDVDHCDRAVRCDCDGRRPCCHDVFVCGTDRDLRSSPAEGQRDPHFDINGREVRSFG